MSARNMAKRTAAGTLALAVCLGGGAIALAGAASAAPGFKFDQRIEGSDRYGTAIAASKAAFPEDGKTANVILVNGYATVDGLTASYLAGVANAPILYVSDQGADAATKAEIKRLGAKNVWLVGGEKVIPTSVEAAIKGDGYSVTRINGSDRYETAAMIAEAGIKIAGKKPSKVIVASGTSFADALAVSPVAFVKGYPIILTEKDSTSDFSKKELGNIGTDAKILVGGTAVVSDKVAADLSIKSDARVAGADRAVTANLVSDWAKKSEGFNPANAALVGGTNGNGADSLVAAPLLGKSFTTLHFAGWDATYVYLKDHSSELTGKGFVFGGKAAVPGDQVDKAQDAAQNAVKSSIKIDDTKASLLSVSTGASDNTGARTFVASGLDASSKYNIALIPTANVKVGADGAITFVDAGGDLTADGTEDGAVTKAKIEVINGVSANVTKSKGVKPADGVIKFVVDSVNYDDVIPVIWLDGSDSAQANGGLDLLEPKTANNDPKAAVEAFALAGATSWKPAEAPEAASVSGGTVLAVASDGKYIVVDDGTDVFTYNLKDGDNYIYDMSITSQANFRSAVSVGDEVDVAYSRKFQSDFTLAKDKPATPTGLKVDQIGNLDSTASSNYDVKFSWKAPEPAQGLIKDYTVTIYTTNAAGEATSTIVGGSGHTTPDEKAELRVDNLANGKYAAKIVANSEEGTSSDASKPVFFTVQKGNADATAPTLVVSSLTTDTTDPGQIGNNDVITLKFSEGMPLASALTSANAAFRISDPDGSIFQIKVGTNATVTSVGTATLPDGSTVTNGQVVLTLTGALTPSGGVIPASSPTVAQTPSTITVFSDVWADAAGNKVDLGGSADKVIDVPLN